MLKFIFLMVALLSTGCSSHVQNSNLTFYDSHGESYNSKSAGKDISKQYNIKNKPTIIALATANAEVKKYTSQLKIINSINAEDYQYILVIANHNNTDKSGYYTSINEAEKILDKDSFKIIIFSGNGIATLISNNIVGRESLIHHLTIK